FEKNKNPQGVASVASFFVRRVDTVVDRELEKNGSPQALALRGKTGIANCRNVYRRFEEIFQGAHFQKLAEKGARVQRPLWASTGTKNPSYSDVMYVEALIGAHTVNTVPPATLEAFRDHGTVKETLKSNIADAQKVLSSVQELGVDLGRFVQEIRAEGFDDVVLLGMGGSSLAPEVFSATFGRAAGYPNLTVLDSTHPDAVRAVEKTVNLERTLFIVSSKSGTTIEP